MAAAVANPMKLGERMSDRPSSSHTTGPWTRWPRSRQSASCSRQAQARRDGLAPDHAVGQHSAGAATYAPIFGEIDELERTARASAEEGAALARAVGFDASPLVVRSDRIAWRANPGSLARARRWRDRCRRVRAGPADGFLLLGSVPGGSSTTPTGPSWWSARGARAERRARLRWCRRRVKTDAQRLAWRFVRGVIGSSVG